MSCRLGSVHIEGLFLGLISIIYFFGELFGNSLSLHRNDKHPFYVAAERPILWSSRIIEFASPIFFVIAVIWTVNNQIYPGMAALGIFGLLFSELYNTNSFYRDSYEFLSVRQRVQKQTLNAQLTSKREKRSFRFKVDWIDTIVFLCDNKWEIVEITQHAEQGLLYSALLSGGIVEIYLMKSSRREIWKHRRFLTMTLRNQTNLQEEFAGVVARVESLRERMGESTRQVEGLFESLLAESFGGG